MNIRDLKYLVAVTDHGHFGKAAKASFVSQPALSIQINKLEKYLGVRLLERTNKSVSLTEAGLIIAERARSILSAIDELQEVAHAAKDSFSGELKLGVFPTLAPYLFPLIIPEISKAYPKLSLYLIEEKTEFLIEKLKQGKIHAAVLSLPFHERGVTVAPLFEEEFLLTVAHQHPFAKKKKISMNELNNNEFLLLEDGHCMRDQMISFCQKANAAETMNFRATSLEALRHMVAAGRGMTLMPRLAAEGCHLATFVPFTNPKPKRTIGIVWRNCSSKVTLLKALAVKVKSIMKQHLGAT